MKQKEKEELRGSTKEELTLQLREITKKFTEKLVGSHKQQSRNTHEALILRKKRAVILTLLREKELSK